MHPSLRPTRALLALALPLLLAACGTTTPPASSTPPSSSQPASSVAPAKPSDARPMAARELYAAALAEAKKIAPDMVLVRAGTQRGVDFEAHVPSDGKSPRWMFAFGSKSKSLEVAIAASSLEVKSFNEAPVAFNSATAIPEAWIDSPAAFDAAQKAGGAAYLTQHPTRAVAFLLEVNPVTKVAAWRVGYSEVYRAGLLSYTIDALDGSLIEKKETPPVGDTPAT